VAIGEPARLIGGRGQDGRQVLQGVHRNWLADVECSAGDLIKFRGKDFVGCLVIGRVWLVGIHGDNIVAIFPSCQRIWTNGGFNLDGRRGSSGIRRNEPRQGLFGRRDGSGRRGGVEPATQENLSQRYKRMGRALALRVALQGVYVGEADSPALLARWYRWAKRSRPAPFGKLATTVKEH